MTDRLRSAVYAAEDQWSESLNRGGKVDFHGSIIEMPVQRRFGDLPAMQSYLDWVMQLPCVMQAFGAISPVTVRARKGQMKAHYESEHQVIAIPLDTAWAGRESVVLHEFAHHVAMSGAVGNEPAHGARFTSTMCVLVECVLGPEAALMLRASYSALDLPTVMP
ncbi:MAG: TIGR04338 family metallohydrolase [Candidatus Nanopelagicales bacterium]